MSATDEPSTSQGEPTTRSVYLITYSQADLQKVCDKKRFADIVIEAFHKDGTAKVIQYCCVVESHEDGCPHYHMLVKLNKQKRWRCVRNYLANIYGVTVHFSDEYSNYYDGYVYVTKSDPSPLLSDDHPVLDNPPRTTNATQARRQGHRRGKKRCFDALDLSEVIEKNTIKDKTTLLNFVSKQKGEGKRDLPLYFLNNPDKCLKIMEATWEMGNAKTLLDRRSSTRMELMYKALLQPCMEECNGQWLILAKKTLENNQIQLREFAGAVSTALEKGRGKKQNVLIIGEGNCGKTFLLKPLNRIYEIFSNPATGSFAWLGVEKAEVIFLNDFRWDAKIIAWSDFLTLLERDSMHFPAPKTSYGQDIFFEKDTPIFATSSALFQKGNNCHKENHMMELRWKTFKFTYEIPESEIIICEPCARCFSDLIINN